MESCLKVSIEDKGKIKEHASHISFKQNPKVLRRSLQVTPVIIDMRDFFAEILKLFFKMTEKMA